MQQTKHIKQRMSQRGDSKDMLNLVLAYGRPEQDKLVLDRKEALELMDAIQRDQRVLKKILDKGGVVVVAEGDALITTYNCEKHHH